MNTCRSLDANICLQQRRVCGTVEFSIVRESAMSLTIAAELQASDNRGKRGI